MQVVGVVGEGHRQKDAGCPRIPSTLSPSWFPESCGRGCVHMHVSSLSDGLSLTKSRRFCINLSLRHRPVTVAILQCYTVRVNVILQSNCKV